MMKMKGFMSGYHTYLLRGGAYRLSHPKLVALFEWVHQDIVDGALDLMRRQQLNEQVEAGYITPDFVSGSIMESPLYGRTTVNDYFRILWRWTEFEWRDMAVQFSTALLLEVGWRESILSETLLQMMPPPIVMASRELHELHEGGAMLEEEFKAVLNSTLAKRVKSKQPSVRGGDETIPDATPERTSTGCRTAPAAQRRWQQLQHVQLQHPPTAAAAGATTANGNYSDNRCNRQPSDWRPGFHGNDNDNRRNRHPSRRQPEGGSDCDGVTKGED